MKNNVQPINPDSGPSIRDQVARLLEETPALTQAQVSRESGVSQARLGQWLKGTYAGDQAATDQQLANWLRDREREIELKGTCPEEPAWYETRNAKLIFERLDFARFFKEVAVIYGDAGASKTHALRRYAATHENVFFITGDPAIKDLPAILSEIIDAMEIKEVKRTARDMRRAILDRVDGAKAVILIDESQYLNDGALNGLRGLYDAAKQQNGGFGLVLCGNDEVFGKVGGDIKKPGFAQWNSRIGTKIKLLGPVASDAKVMCEAWGIADAELVKEITRVVISPGGLRSATKVVKMAMVLALGEEKPLAVSHIETAWRETRAAR